jgi:hypothetical protein
VYISFEPLELRKIFCRDDGTKGVCKLDDLSPYGLATNYFLRKIKIIDDANCNFCQKENETIEHIFWGCENVQNLLGQVNSWFGDKGFSKVLQCN